MLRALALVGLLALAVPASCSALELAATPGGDTITAFVAGGQRGQPLEVVIGRAGGARVRSQVLARRNARNGVVAVNARGDAIVAWHEGAEQRSRVMVAQRAAGGRFGAPQALSGPLRPVSIAAAIGSGGEALVAWPGASGVDVALRPAGRATFDAARAVPAPGYIADAFPRIDAGIDSSANAVLAFTVFVGDQPRFLVTQRPAGGAFGAPQAVPSVPATTDGRLVSDDAGRQLIAWSAAGAIAVSERTGGAVAFPAPTTLTGPDDGPAALDDVALGAGGAASVVWATSDGRLRAASRPPGGAFGAPQTLAPFAEPPYDGLERALPRTAVDPSGAVAVVWRAGRTQIRAAYAAPGAPFGAPLALLNGARSTRLGAGDPRLTAAPDGSFVAGWEQSDGERAGELLRTFGAAGPAPAVRAATQRAYSRGPARGCYPPAGRTRWLASGVRVFSARLSRAAGAPTVLFACLKRRRVPVEIGFGTFGRATEAIAAPLAASTEVICDAQSCSTQIHVYDLRDPRAFTFSSPVSDATVTELRLQRDGHVAWIECTTSNGTLDEPCRRGQVTSLWIADVYLGRTREVARGHTIAARSLRLAGDRVLWTQSGGRRSAALRIPT